MYFHSSFYLSEAIEMQYHNSKARKLKFTDMENISRQNYSIPRNTMVLCLVLLVLGARDSCRLEKYFYH